MTIDEALQHCSKEEREYFLQHGGLLFIERLGEARARVAELENELSRKRIEDASSMKDTVDTMMSLHIRLTQLERLASMHSVHISSPGKPEGMPVDEWVAKYHRTPGVIKIVNAEIAESNQQLQAENARLTRERDEARADRDRWKEVAKTYQQANSLRVECLHTLPRLENFVEEQRRRITEALMNPPQHNWDESLRELEEGE